MLRPTRAFISTLWLAAFVAFAHASGGAVLHPIHGQVFYGHPVVMHHPVVVHQPVVVQHPVITQRVVVQQPVVVRQQVVVRQPVVVHQPVIVRAQPVVVQQRVVVQPRPVVVQPHPVVIQQPVVVQQPRVVHPPVVVQQPVVVQHPPVQRPVIVHEPQVIEEPIDIPEIVVEAIRSAPANIGYVYAIDHSGRIVHYFLIDHSSQGNSIDLILDGSHDIARVGVYNPPLGMPRLTSAQINFRGGSSRLVDFNDAGQFEYIDISPVEGISSVQFF